MNYIEKTVVNDVRIEFMSLEELLNYISKNKYSFNVNKEFKEYNGENVVEYDIATEEVNFNFKKGIKLGAEFEVEVPNTTIIDFYDDYNLNYTYINEQGVIVNIIEETSIFNIENKYGDEVLSVYLVDKDNRFLTILYHKDEN